MERQIGRPIQHQPAPPDDEQDQANMQALEARLSSSGNVNDAWALYNARKGAVQRPQSQPTLDGR
jgi:hypothetical protein